MEAAWWKAVRPGLWGPAATADAESRERKLAVLSALAQAGTRMPMVGLDQLRVLLGAEWRETVSNEELRSVLESLHRDGHVTPFRDWDRTASSYTDARRRKESWSLSHDGRVEVQKLREATADLERPLQMPPGLLTTLRSAVDQVLSALEDSDASGSAEVAQQVEGGLSAIAGHLKQLQSAAGDFYEALATLDEQDVTRNELFRLSRQRIITVLDEFKRRTDSALGPARESARRLRALGYTHIAERAVDAAGLFSAEKKPLWIAAKVAELETLDGWLEDGGVVDQMIGNAMEAIRTLLGAIERRFHAHARGSDLATDFHRLAVMVHRQYTDEQAHQVFAAALGMWPARHPRRPSHDRAPTSAWPGSVTASTTLRQYEGGGARRSVPRRIPDTTAAKQQALLAEAAELARLERVCRDLLTERPVTLAHFSGLSVEHRDVLIPLIEDAMDAFDPVDGFGRSVNALCELRWWPIAPASPVTVQFAEGTLLAFDVRIQITSTYLTGSAHTEEAA